MQEQRTFDDLVEVDILSPDNFLKIKETLERIGILSVKNKTLTQTCHIFHKRGRYAIVHFKEMFELDGKTSDLSLSDIERRDTIIDWLECWGLLEVLTPSKLTESPEGKGLTIIKHSDRDKYTLCQKHDLGSR